jgi:branched-chain amino acid transport system substrate-binding protein
MFKYASVKGYIMRRAFFMILLLLFVVGCSNNVVEESVELEPIKVGVVGPFSGPIAFYGERMRDGFEMALEEINSLGGVDGRLIELVYEDDGCRPQNTVNVVHKLVEMDEVVALLGPFCGSSVKAAANLVDEKKVFLITPGDNFGKLTKYYFSTRFLIGREGEELANVAFESGVKKVGVIHIDNDWAHAYIGSFGSELERLGGELTVVESYDYSDSDFRTRLAKISESGADAILVLYGRGGLVFNQIRELGLNLTLLSDMAVEEPYEIQGAAGADEGVLYVYSGGVDKGFESEFMSRYNRSSGIVNRDSYDALMILRDALLKCGNSKFNSDCLGSYVAMLKDYQSASGVLDYDVTTGGFGKVLAPKVIRNSVPMAYS